MFLYALNYRSRNHAKYQAKSKFEGDQKLQCQKIFFTLIDLFVSQKGNPLKLVIMSATLRVEDFTENQHLFRIMPPVVRVS